MRWKKVLSWSCSGVFMGLASIMGWTQGLELVLWIAIYVACAMAVGRTVPERHFQHGAIIGLLMGGLASGLQALFFDTYAANDPKILEQTQELPGGISPRAFFFMLAPLSAVVSGLMLGLLTWGAGKLLSRGASRHPVG